MEKYGEERAQDILLAQISFESGEDPLLIAVDKISWTQGSSVVTGEENVSSIDKMYQDLANELGVTTANIDLELPSLDHLGNLVVNIRTNRQNQLKPTLFDLDEHVGDRILFISGKISNE